MKDPAVLFYTSDFLTGTMLMTYAQKGKYITLLCLQHQQGRLTEDDMLSVCGEYDKKIFSKFLIDENGLYYNERMEIEANKRKAYSESRAKNRCKKDKNICEDMKSYEKHMENENEDEIIIDNDIDNININSISYGYDLARKRAIENGEIDE